MVNEAFPSGRPFQEIVHLTLERGPGSAVFFAQVPVFPGRSRPLSGDQRSRVRDTFKQTKSREITVPIDVSRRTTTTTATVVIYYVG